MKKIINLTEQLVTLIWPKSKWGNLIYLIVGFLTAHFTDIENLIEQISDLFK